MNFMDIETNKKLIFHDNDGKRFLAEDVARLSVLAGTGYEKKYLVKLRDGGELNVTDSDIINAHENPMWLYVPK